MTEVEVRKARTRSEKKKQEEDDEGSLGKSRKRDGDGDDRREKRSKKWIDEGDKEREKKRPSRPSKKDRSEAAPPVVAVVEQPATARPEAAVAVATNGEPGADAQAAMTTITVRKVMPMIESRSLSLRILSSPSAVPVFSWKRGDNDVLRNAWDRFTCRPIRFLLTLLVCRTRCTRPILCSSLPALVRSSCPRMTRCI